MHEGEKVIIRVSKSGTLNRVPSTKVVLYFHITTTTAVVLYSFSY